MAHLLSCLWLYVAIFLDVALGFSFTTSGSPFQCDDLSVSWTGGTPPFSLIIVAIHAANINISIPSDSFSDNKGTFTTQLPVPRGTQIMLSMSDATGPLSGGTSNVLTVGDTQTGKSCNTTLPGNDFFFSTDETLEQCKPYPFTLFDGAVLPLTIYGYIPGGHDSFVLNPPSAPSFTWIANLKAQTQVAFTVTDSQGRRGGTDTLRTVFPSNDSSCLPTGTDTSSSQSFSTSSTATVTPDDSQHTLSTGAIAGVAAGGAVVGVIVLGVIWCLCRRRNAKKRPRSIDLTEHYRVEPFHPEANRSSQQMVSSPFTLGAEGYPPMRPPHSLTSQSDRDSRSSFPESAPLTSFTSGSKGSSNQARSQSTYIVHRDIEDTMPPIELPPEYSERRAPIQGLSEYSSPIDSTSSNTSFPSSSTRPIKN